jgi:osmotically-inducible protein OsmY
MTKTQKLSATVIALAAGVAATSMFVNHRNDAKAPRAVRADVLATAPKVSDSEILAAIQKADAPVGGLVVRNVDGIVILRGEGDAATAERAVTAVRSLGFTRVANLIRPLSFDDDSLRRDAERQLAQTRSLDGCMLRVSCERGTIHLSGTVQNEFQQDVAKRILKNVNGARDVKVELTKI